MESTDRPHDQQLLDAYLFGQRVFMQAHDINVTGSQAAKTQQLLRAVAAGDETTLSTPAELLSKFPNAPRRVRDHLEQNANKFMQYDRLLAQNILSAMQDRYRSIMEGDSDQESRSQ